MGVVLAGLLLALCLGCGGTDDGPEELRIYHLETAIGPPGDEGELQCGPPRLVCPGVIRQPPSSGFRYAVRSDPGLTSEHIERSTVRQAVDPSTGAPVVHVRFTSEGRRAFAALTKEAARVGGRDLGWHHVAIVVGDEIVAFPQIDYDSFPDGFPNAREFQIAAASDADADQLVRRLRGS